MVDEMSNIELLKKIESIAEEHPAYPGKAYMFVLIALEYTVSKLPERRHLTGQELSHGIADFARQQFGFLAREVLESWGLHNTADFGNIVYVLIEHGILSKTKDDSLEDFIGVFDFSTEFVWSKLETPDLPERL
jgi:uncharacterized repeat protein (TIGR04138 family)